MCRLKNKTKILLLFLIVFQFACAQKKERETVYLIFEDGKETNCVKLEGKLRSETKKVKYNGSMLKQGTKEAPYFFICREKFPLVKDSKVETVDSKEIKKLNVVDFDYFIKERFDSQLFSKQKVFENIYFLERDNDGNFNKYEVRWRETAHNRGI